MSTPRDYNQPPWPQQPRRGPDPGPAAGTPWYQQPVARPPYPPAGQYGAPGQYGRPGQYGPPGQYGQPPQWGQPGPTPSPDTSKAKGSKSKPFLIAGAVAAVLIVGVVVVLLVSSGLNRDSKKVAVAGVQTQVEQTLVDRITGYSSGDISDVRCNDGRDPTVKKGGSFTCDVTVRGQRRQLKVTFQDDSGTYWVGLPQLEGGK
ncbi:DUF4333 domain-containing protein [Mycobacterium sp. 23]|uniref:DUF4333 domain-containing protein n=1 Tax=Mycobacterium sp. 23 TaxID=3400424 RepID=UPI003AAE1E28